MSKPIKVTTQADALKFVLEEILHPFGESSLYDDYQEADRLEGKLWNDRTWHEAMMLLWSLHGQLVEDGND